MFDVLISLNYNFCISFDSTISYRNHRSLRGKEYLIKINISMNRSKFTLYLNDD